MNIHEIRTWLNQHLEGSFTLVPTNKGISNASYLLEYKNKVYIVRVPKKNHHLLATSFQHESIILDKVKDLDVPILYFNTDNGIKISKFIPKVKEFAEENHWNKFNQVGKMLRILHSKPAVEFYFDPFEKLVIYKNRIKNPIVHFDHEEEIIAQVKGIYTPTTLCHNDVVSGNLLFADQETYLIDYEYAAMNDFRFDIASFFSENKIIQQEERNRFYEGYGISSTIDSIIGLFECFEDILWGYWANMLWEERQDPIYQQIAKDKKNHYIQSLKTFFNEQNIQSLKNQKKIK